MSSTKKKRGDDRHHELERTLRHALALAGGTQAAEHTIKRSSPRAHRARTLIRVTPHIVGYGALLGYILARHRAAAGSD
jgi:hypothetical protein